MWIIGVSHISFLLLDHLLPVNSMHGLCPGGDYRLRARTWDQMPSDSAGSGGLQLPSRFPKGGAQAGYDPMTCGPCANALARCATEAYLAAGMSRCFK